jgi:hypothetical protein
VIAANIATAVAMSFILALTCFIIGRLQVWLAARKTAEIELAPE